MTEDQILANILRRYLTEDEPGCSMPAFHSFRGDELRLDGCVQITPLEQTVIEEVIEGEGGAHTGRYEEHPLDEQDRQWATGNSVAMCSNTDNGVAHVNDDNPGSSMCRTCADALPIPLPNEEATGPTMSEGEVAAAMPHLHSLDDVAAEFGVDLNEPETEALSDVLSTDRRFRVNVPWTRASAGWVLPFGTVVTFLRHDEGEDWYTLDGSGEDIALDRRDLVALS